MTKLIVDLVLPEAVSESAPLQEAAPALAETVVHRSRKCSCGSEEFVLANEMPASELNGLPASRMYECVGCGEYRLD